MFDHTSLKADKVDASVVAFFDDLDPTAGDVLIGTGWALAEDLEKYA